MVMSRKFMLLFTSSSNVNFKLGFRLLDLERSSCVFLRNTNNLSYCVVSGFQYNSVCLDVMVSDGWQAVL
jgi:hypothetical protein